MFEGQVQWLWHCRTLIVCFTIARHCSNGDWPSEVGCFDCPLFCFAARFAIIEYTAPFRGFHCSPLWSSPSNSWLCSAILHSEFVFSLRSTNVNANVSRNLVLYCFFFRFSVILDGVGVGTGWGTGWVLGVGVGVGTGWCSLISKYFSWIFLHPLVLQWIFIDLHGSSTNYKAFTLVGSWLKKSSHW